MNARNKKITIIGISITGLIGLPLLLLVLFDLANRMSAPNSPRMHQMMQENLALGKFLGDYNKLHGGLPAIPANEIGLLIQESQELDDQAKSKLLEIANDYYWTSLPLNEVEPETAIGILYEQNLNRDSIYIQVYFGDGFFLGRWVSPDALTRHFDAEFIEQFKSQLAQKNLSAPLASLDDYTIGLQATRGARAIARIPGGTIEGFKSHLRNFSNRSRQRPNQ